MGIVGSRVRTKLTLAFGLAAAGSRAGVRAGSGNGAPVGMFWAKLPVVRSNNTADKVSLFICLY
jgi:hypothetical protein